MGEAFVRIKMAFIFWLARRLPACDEVLTLISESMDRKLPWRQRMTLLLHNQICVWCKRYANQLLILRQAMRSQENENALLANEILSPDARERMKRLLDPK
ncbi:hypothetical protein L0222_15475 [bacterium]|nr:hypothetical protein [bacterium]MCI0603216.1 hypothetical protein [bacterium]